MAKPPFIVIPYDIASIAATYAASARPASHLAEYLFPQMVWNAGEIQPVQNVIMDLGVTRAIDFMALLGVESGPAIQFLFHLGSTLENVDIYSSGVAPHTAPVPPRENGRADFYHDLPTSYSARYPTIQSVANSGKAMGAQFAIVGKKITFQRNAEHDWDAGAEDQSQISITTDGVPDITPGAIMRRLSFTMKWVSSDEYFEKVAPLDQAVGRQKPVLICFDEDSGNRRQALTYFGLLRENPSNKRINARAFERRFEILSFI